MKRLFIILIFTFISSQMHAQFVIYEILKDGYNKTIATDSLATISSNSMELIIVSNLSITKHLSDIVNKHNYSGTICYGFTIKNNKHIETKLLKGIDSIIDPVVKPQIEHIFHSIQDYFNFDSSKNYFVKIPILLDGFGTCDSIYYTKDEKKKIVFQIKKEQIIFHPENLSQISPPKDLAESMVQLDLLFDSITKEQILNWEEYEFYNESHYGLNMWILKNWNLWEESNLTMYFNTLGIFKPNNMVRIILHSYYRQLKGQKIMLKEQVENYSSEINDYSLNNKTQVFNQFYYEVGDTVTYNYYLGFLSKEQLENYDSKKCYAKGKILSINMKKRILKIKLLDDCCGQGILYIDIREYRKLKDNDIDRNVLYQKVVKRMRPGEKKWNFIPFWKSKSQFSYQLSI